MLGPKAGEDMRINNNNNNNNNIEYDSIQCCRNMRDSKHEELPLRQCRVAPFTASYSQFI